MSAPLMFRVRVWLAQIDVLLAVAVNTGVLASAVMVTVATAELQLLTVFVTCTVKTPLPLATGLLLVVLFKLPVLGTVHV